MELTRLTELILAKSRKTCLALTMLNKVNMKTHHTTDGNEAFTLLELLLVILVLIILVAMFLPANSGPRGRDKARRINCVNNLKEMGLAFRVWEGDNLDKFPIEVSATNTDAMKLVATGNAYVFWQIISNELSTPKILYCTADQQKSPRLILRPGSATQTSAIFSTWKAMKPRRNSFSPAMTTSQSKAFLCELDC